MCAGVAICKLYMAKSGLNKTSNARKPHSMVRYISFQRNLHFK